MQQKQLTAEQARTLICGAMNATMVSGTPPRMAKNESKNQASVALGRLANTDLNAVKATLEKMEQANKTKDETNSHVGSDSGTSANPLRYDRFCPAAEPITRRAAVPTTSS